MQKYSQKMHLLNIAFFVIKQMEVVACLAQNKCQGTPALHHLGYFFWKIIMEH